VTDPGVKGFRLGTHRLNAPEQTIDKVWRLRGQLGITRVADVTGLDTIGVPVVSVYRPNARSLATAHGKGMSLALARASGLMEAAESFHAEHIVAPLRLASYMDLRRIGIATVDPMRLPRTRHSNFDPTVPILWIEGCELFAREPVWLPFECVHTNFTTPLPTGSGAFTLTSNGLASGNHLLEATSHGICEVIERDAHALWNARPEDKRLGERRVDLATVEDESCRHVLECFSRAGLAVGCWDISSDIGVPCMACFLVDAQPHPVRLLYATSGLGCHPTPSIALLRAMTEAAQCRLTFISGARDDSDREIYERARNRDAIEKTRQRLEDSHRAIDFRTLTDNATQTFEDDIRWQLARLRSAAVEQVVVVDLSKEEIGIPVVRVVIPGLEGIHDVPGYLAGPRARAFLEA
jgi:ribosomal protein S12 methylthiotransferase accessory factor